MEFKSIIAITNGNDELEFHCYTHLIPGPSYPIDAAVYKSALLEWEQSVQVFKAFDLHQEIMIKQEVIDFPEWRSNLLMSYKLGINVTAIVDIKHSIRKGIDKYAFYKSPSKEDPVAEAQESQRQLLNELVMMFWHETVFKDEDSRLKGIRKTLANFKITRLPKA